VHAKAGILALLLKNIKLIFLAVAGAGGFIWKKSPEEKKKNHLRNLQLRLSKQRLKL
jgi:hypothetical protein